MEKISIVLPARNEEHSLRALLPELQSLHPAAEIIVVDDASTDETARVCEENKIKLIKHPYSMGNGAAVKSGARAATGDVLVFMDADGQHSPADVKTLLQTIDQGYDMVVGARSSGAHGSLFRYLGNKFYNHLASWISAHKVVDLTSGFRAVRRDKFLEFISMLPNGFSYPTTITMSFFRVGYPLSYVPVDVKKDGGESHIHLLKDGVKFLLIIFRIAAFYSPLKIFAPVSVGLFLSGLSYYAYTFFTQSRFTNMSMLLFLTAIIVFLIGLLAEQITFLIYSQNQKK